MKLDGKKCRGSLNYLFWGGGMKNMKLDATYANLWAVLRDLPFSLVHCLDWQYSDLS